MKATVPEIAWHNKNPVFTVDIQGEINESFYRAATGGGDSHIVIWHIVLKEDEDENETVATIDFAADLDRHIKAVNVVRFGSNSKLLASGDDDAVIIIWSLKEDQGNCNSSFTSEEGNKENWTSIKVLRGHKDDIYDICWSPFSNEFISGSVDNTALLWNITKGQSTGKLGEHSGFVQGVAWDPKGKYLATLCSDRALRLFDAETKKMVAKVTKAKIPAQEEKEDENFVRLFHDDTVKTFFRRLCFSPDGSLVFAPCGIYNDSDCETKPPKDVTYIFLKTKPERPVFHLPSRDEYTVAVKCCPILFELNPINSNLFTLPYRIIFAIASRKSIVFYDTQQLQPFGIVSDIHYATLTDISWSPDGRFLLASSSDGYCTIVTFNKGELGVPYSKMPSIGNPKPSVDILEDLGVEPLDRSIIQKLNGVASKSVNLLKPKKLINKEKLIMNTSASVDENVETSEVIIEDQTVVSNVKVKADLCEGQSKENKEELAMNTSAVLDESMETSELLNENQTAVSDIEVTVDQSKENKEEVISSASVVVDENMETSELVNENQIGASDITATANLSQDQSRENELAMNTSALVDETRKASELETENQSVVLNVPVTANTSQDQLTENKELITNTSDLVSESMETSEIVNENQTPAPSVDRSQDLLREAVVTNSDIPKEEENMDVTT